MTITPKQSYINKLTEAGFNLESLTADDFPEVHDKLGWAESTFATALSFLGKGHLATRLHRPIRDYVPTPDEVRAIRDNLGAFGIVLTFLGCRFSEMWRIAQVGSTYVVDTKKNGAKVIISRSELDDFHDSAFKTWLLQAPTISEKGMRWRWNKLRESGKISAKCTSHTFRHRLITELVDKGITFEQITSITGHRNFNNIKRYVHQNPTRNTQLRMELIEDVEHTRGPSHPTRETPV